jgi:N-acetylglucosaminyldiphosphoundecaprenol N-acetyl-beta-D-mannosaminyltransferase
VSDRVRVGGLDFDVITGTQLIAQVTDAIGRGQGGTIVTPNVDICRLAGHDPVSRDLVAAATIVVADGMPLVWAARLSGRPLSERITGADLIFALSEIAAANSWPVYLIGGLPGADGLPGAAELAARGIAERYPGIQVAGAWSPPARFDAVADDVEEMRAELAAAQPKIVFVGLGFPKQEHLIARLAADLPGTWFMGCGAAILFAGGTVRRAPGWMQRAGLEWFYRLISEPRRLARRYLVDDLPFAVRLLAGSFSQRRRGVADGAAGSAAEERPAA